MDSNRPDVSGLNPSLIHTPKERPYRSHLQPACLSCRRRKSRCKIRNGSTVCANCDVHGTECVFPQTASSPKSQRRTRASTTPRPPFLAKESAPRENAGTRVQHTVLSPGQIGHSRAQSQNEPTSLDSMIAESGDASSHVVSPTFLDDNHDLQAYMSTTQHRSYRTMPPSTRPVLFNTVLRRPLGVNLNQSLASSKCQMIEKLVEPHVNDLLDM